MSASDPGFGIMDARGVITMLAGHQESPELQGGGFFCGVDHPDRAANIGGPFPWVVSSTRASSAREHQQDDEAGGNNRDLQVQRQREVGGGTEEVEESAHPAIRPCRCCAAVRHLARVKK